LAWPTLAGLMDLVTVIPVMLVTDGAISHGNGIGCWSMLHIAACCEWAGPVAFAGPITIGCPAPCALPRGVATDAGRSTPPCPCTVCRAGFIGCAMALLLSGAFLRRCSIGFLAGPTITRRGACAPAGLIVPCIAFTCRLSSVCRRCSPMLPCEANRKV
jgi:hypothetical protein